MPENSTARNTVEKDSIEGSDSIYGDNRCTQPLHPGVVGVNPSFLLA